MLQIINPLFRLALCSVERKYNRLSEIIKYTVMFILRLHIDLQKYGSRTSSQLK